MPRLTFLAVLVSCFVLLFAVSGCITGGPDKTDTVTDTMSFNEYMLNQSTVIYKEKSTSSPKVGTFRKGSKVLVYERTDDGVWALIKAAHYDEKVYKGWIKASHLSKP
ncbi:MAG: SH3 domain-containing protein [Desulfovibrionaceae bacterium]